MPAPDNRVPSRILATNPPVNMEFTQPQGRPARSLCSPDSHQRRRRMIPYSPTKPAPSGRPPVLRIPYRPTNARPYQLPTRTAVFPKTPFSRMPPFSRMLPAGVIPYPPTTTAPNRAAFRYRTPWQRNTVLCNKRLPYRPTNACFFGHPSGTWTGQSRRK
jgi:hypothetical protein